MSELWEPSEPEEGDGEVTDLGSGYDSDELATTLEYMLSNYNYSGLTYSSPFPTFIACPYGHGGYYTLEEAYVPPLVYIPEQQAQPATPTQVSYKKRLGWSSWARSVNPLTKGNFVDISCNTGIYGGCICIGSTSFLGASINSFSHTLMVDQDGVHVREYGVVVATLGAFQSAESKLRIYWRDDYRLVYTMVTDTDTEVYTSANKYVFPNAYVFGYLYSSDDRIISAALTSGKVHYGGA